MSVHSNTKQYSRHLKISGAFSTPPTELKISDIVTK